MAADYIPYTGPIVTHREALASGLMHFFTGVPCKYGHLSQRMICNSRCVQCNREWRRRWHAENRDESKALSRAYYWSNREEQRAYKRARQHISRPQQRENYLANREKRRVWRKEWTKNNPSKIAAYNRNGKARRKNAVGKHNHDDVVRLRVLQKDRCAMCRTPLRSKGTVDHIVALKNGGTNWPANLQLLCVSCNSSKRDDDPNSFRATEGPSALMRPYS